MKISFITTVLNEEKSIGRLLDSLESQTLKPNEIVIVDGGSTDNTLSVISNFKFQISNRTKIKVLVKKGNRSAGRNAAIESSMGDITLCSDAGCILDKNWIKNIIKPFKDPDVDVVAGYYKGIRKTIFQKCIIPYVLVMPDRVDSSNFLPATRSIAFKKSVWKKNGGFDESLSHNEDYALARKLKKKNFKIVFEKNAIVYWTPPNNFKKAFVMFLRFAYGDIESKILRPKVLFIFLRYFVGVLLLFIAIINVSVFMIELILFLFIFYTFWSIAKNYKYVNDLRAIIVLPFLQFTSDLAVIMGTLGGVLKYGLQK